MQTQITSLPVDTLRNIFCYLDVKSLSRISLVCKEWTQYANVDSELWKLIYYHSFMKPSYCHIQSKNTPEKETDGPPPAKKQKIEVVFSVTKLSKQELHVKEKQFMNNGDDTTNWKSLSLFREKLHQLNHSSVRDTLEQLVNDPSILELSCANLNSNARHFKTYKKKPVETEQLKPFLLEHTAAKATSFIWKMKEKILSSWIELLKPSTPQVIVQYLKHHFYYYGIYHHNGTNGYEYEVSIDTKFVMFHPTTGIPICFASEFMCHGSRGEEEDAFGLHCSTDQFKNNPVLNCGISSYHTKDQQKAHIGNKVVSSSLNKQSTVKPSILKSCFEKVFEEDEAQKLFMKKISSLLKDISVACDPSYGCYINSTTF
jgi:hypothetical protein